MQLNVALFDVPSPFLPFPCQSTVGVRVVHIFSLMLVVHIYA
jgi:hypothetical protein